MVLLWARTSTLAYGTINILIPEFQKVLPLFLRKISIHAYFRPFGITPIALRRTPFVVSRANSDGSPALMSIVIGTRGGLLPDCNIRSGLLEIKSGRKTRRVESRTKKSECQHLPTN